MKAIIYYATLPFLYGVSLLPFWALYLLSDLICFIVYRVIGYRTKIVGTNLRNAFPEKSEQELLEIQREFYRYFCDLLLETLKTLTIQPKTLLKRVTFENEEVYERFLQEKQSVIIVMGHLGNWELTGARFSQTHLHQLYVIFHPLSNKYFNNLVYHMRTRLGNKLYAMRETFRGMVKNRNAVTATAFIADQTPSSKDAYWTTFLNQETPVFKGTAKIAKKMKYPIIYVSVQRLKRGYYRISNELLVEYPTQLSEDEITELHTRRLEADIVKTPAYWLWTHRRWKHKKVNV